MQYRASRVVAGPFLHVLWRPEVTGLENIPETGGALLASNHLSILDSIFLPLWWPPGHVRGQVGVLHRYRLVDRVTAMYMRATNQLSVDRGGARAAQAMLEAALERVNGRGAVRHLPRGHPVAGRPAVPGPDRDRLAGAELRRAGHPGRHDRHRPRAAARAHGAAALPDPGPDRLAADLRRVATSAAPGKARRSPTRSWTPSGSSPARSTCRCTPRSARSSSPPPTPQTQAQALTPPAPRGAPAPLTTTTPRAPRPETMIMARNRCYSPRPKLGWPIQCVPRCLWMRSSASRRWPGRGSAAVMMRVPVRRVASVRLWATTGAFAFPVTCRAS